MTYASYMICTAPRSGSTLLLNLLAATGVAGNPESWFYRRSVDDWRDRVGVPEMPDLPEREMLEAVFRAAIMKGGGNGPFGLRQQGESFPFLFEKLALLHPEEVTDVARFQRVFGPTLFVHLIRPDKVDQAVSYLKAEQSGLWHVAEDGSELERVAPHQDPVYDREKLRACAAMLVGYDREWIAWFQREGITPVRISYDHLAADPHAVLRDLLGQLGLDPAAADGVSVGVRKLADQTSREWVARFRAEEGLI